MNRKLAIVTLLVLFTAGLCSEVNAAPWRGHWRRCWAPPVVRVCPPAPRVFVPPVPVPPPVVVGGYYGPRYRHCYRAPGYYRYRHCGPRYYR